MARNGVEALAVQSSGMVAGVWRRLCACGLAGFVERACKSTPFPVSLAMKRKISELERKNAMETDTSARMTGKRAVKSLLGGLLADAGETARTPVAACMDTGLIVESATVSGSVYRFRVASDFAARERVYRFAHEIYSGVSLAQGDAGMVVSPYDAGPETLTLLAETEDGTIVGTVSLVFDSDKGLPCDEIYWVETGRMRAEDRSMAEVTRLALRKDCEHSREVLLRLFNLIYIYARRVRGYTDFVIEVHPRHLKYYERALGFEVTGAEQKCPRVGGAPAVLARLDLAVPTREVERVGGRGPSAKERTLYPHFWSADREPALAETMAAVYRPMTEHEARYFGIADEHQKEGALAS